MRGDRIIQGRHHCGDRSVSANSVLIWETEPLSIGVRAIRQAVVCADAKVGHYFRGRMEMTVFDYMVLSVAPGTASAVVAALRDSLLANDNGRLVGCWVSEIGRLNEIVVVRSFESEAIREENQFGTVSRLPGMAVNLIAVRQEVFTAAKGMPCAQAGSFGAFYEIRRYELNDGGLAPTLAAWREAVPARIALSPLVLMMHPVKSATCIVHIWPFETLDQRQGIRAKAFSEGIWPPKDTARWIKTAETGIFAPTVFSPLR